MAAGEYVSVKSQEDTERADLRIEAEALANNREEEEKELAAIYQSRGLDEKLAEEVARQLMKHDALGAHARDEIGITAELGAKPMQAALWSAAAFSAAPPCRFSRRPSLQLRRCSGWFQCSRLDCSACLGQWPPPREALRCFGVRRACVSGGHLRWA
jgi:hypothetical protein